MIPSTRLPRRRRRSRVAAWVALTIGALAARGTAQETLLETIPPDRELAGNPVFSPDGMRVAYAATTSEGRVVVVDGEAGEASAYADSPVFSADGKHLAYRAGRRVSPTAEQWWIVKDGRKLEVHDWVGPPALTANGMRVAYWAGKDATASTAEQGKGGRYFVVFGGKKGPVYAGGDTLSPPVLSPDGKLVGYKARDGHEWFVVAGKHTSRRYPLVGTPAFPPNGRGFAYPVFDNARWLLVRERNGRDSTFDFVGRPVFAPRGGSVAFAAKSAGKRFVVQDGLRLPGEYDAVGTPVFSATGKQVAYRANRGGAIPGAGIPGLAKRAPVGAGAVRGGKWLVVVGKIESREFEQVGDPVFSGDGEFVAHAAYEDGKWRMVVGEKESRAFDHVGPPVFGADHRSLGFGAREGRKLIWVRMGVR